jgi:hypothetical protein
MKTPNLFPVLFAGLLASLSSVASASDTVKYELVLYVFKSSAVQRTYLSKGIPGKPPLSGQALPFGQPATVNFDQDQLVLEGGKYTWNGGRNPPLQFKVTEIPPIITALGQAATIRAVVPVQFLEKMPDGSLQVRTMSGDLKVTPHYQFILNVRPVTDVVYGNDLVITCQMDIATVQGREKIPDIELEVGRPILARFDQTIELESKKDEWAGLLIPGPKGSDYTLLMLLKVSHTSDAPALTGK